MSAGSKEHVVPKETNTIQQWRQIRKGMLKTMLHSATKELFVPLNILRIYYQTLCGASIEEIKSTNIVGQTKWLLYELSKEYQNKEDDLVKTTNINDESISILTDIDDLLKVKEQEKEKLLKKRREKIAELNSLVQHLEQVYQTKEALDDMFDKIKSDTDELKKSSDDLILSDTSDEVDRTVKHDNNKSEINDDKDNNLKKSNDDIKTRINHVVDELWSRDFY